MDGGNNTHATGLTNDQRGAPILRIVGGGSGTATVDIGAFEFHPLVVDTLADESDDDYSTGDLSLREATELANANPQAETITFDSSLTGGTITLSATLGELTIINDVTITGLGRDDLTVSGNNATRVFNVDDGTTATLTVLIEDLTITGGNPGGVVNRENLTLQNSSISSNSAGIGGGVFNISGTLTVANSIVSGNSANFAGGGLYNGFFNGSAAMTVRNSTITANSAGQFGGGLSSRRYLTIVNSTISGDSSAEDGGGLFNSLGTVTVQNSTFSENASQKTGGVYNASGTVTLMNSIVTGSQAPSVSTGHEIFNDAGAVIADANNLLGAQEKTNAQAFDGFTPGANGITATSDGTDPTKLPQILKRTLINNGGPTPTLALVDGSPAIDAGDCTHATGLTTDQRGDPFLRIADGGSGTATVDIGAVERQTVTFAFPLEVDTLAVALVGERIDFESRNENEGLPFHRADIDRAELERTGKAVEGSAALVGRQSDGNEAVIGGVDGRAAGNQGVR